MKIGFSLGRCVRDIVNDTVSIDDVYLIVSRTLIHDSSQIDDIIDSYLSRPDYLAGLDEGRCYDVAHQLYLSGRIYQPRVHGFNPRKVSEDAVWMDLMPTIMGEDQATEQVQAAWRQYQLALKMTSLRQYPSKHEADSRLRDDF
jgi:hypothetical protein